MARPSAVVPAGWQSVTASRARVVIAVPGNWTMLDASDFDTSSPTFLANARRMHQSPAQVRRELTQFDFVAASPDHDGLVECSLTSLTALPTYVVLQAAYVKLSLAMNAFAHVTTPLGPAVVTHSTGGNGRHVNAIYVSVPRGIVDIAVAARTAARADALTNSVLRSLRLAR
ncbi:hypothetical protein Back2_13020 [Nocardioides baekrokdamisoli]|uniref:Uncharacterized protein n=1 Tax=Nocardioides baekrokdamisoli TaxID=1804624 RepID=A0A3G9ILX3_9ACTN|nr:hypothetical protein Back2_13020 [Nocardioides baekrokdamisoli]